ncbi:DNA alkylation repair protein [Sandaracinus amylolyticus]|uniref:DNA alkylation repair protein n=1 Tax=Sandaracinus amylolyticus TaxID=927083 RepID=UPI001F1771F5|nr:DNA alkylation repair protein [Sandaracinus amylolyticus]UJR86927.1 Hypothetical protein I5071_90280 [Sandaracinus amylolyticus]
MTTANDAIAFFTARFEAEGDPERAASEKAYMKSELAFHGVPMAAIRSAARDFEKAHRDLDRAALRAIGDALFASGWFDLRHAAIALLERKRRVLAPDDLAWLVSLARDAAAWAHVDWLATKVIGAVLEAHPASSSIVETWARDEDVWVRRTALLAHLDVLRAGEGDFDRWRAIAEPMLDDRSFWIRKAIGWVLRDISRKRPALTETFLRANGSRCSGLTYREASKHLPSEVRAELDALRA